MLRGQAYKGKGEEYRLFWSDRPEFVRMAARYGATIVPFAGVGAEEGFEMLLDPGEIRRLPVLGSLIEQRSRSTVPQARRYESRSRSSTCQLSGQGTSRPKVHDLCCMPSAQRTIAHV